MMIITMIILAHLTKIKYCAQQLWIGMRRIHDGSVRHATGNLSICLNVHSWFNFLSVLRLITFPHSSYCFKKKSPRISTWLMAIFSKTGMIKNQRLQYKHVNPSPLGSARLLFPVRKWQTANYVLFNLDGCGTPKISKTSCMAQTAKESFCAWIGRLPCPIQMNVHFQ